MDKYPHCPQCTRSCKDCHNFYYDAYFCPDCDIWVEKICDDKYCSICRFRPEKPTISERN